MALAHSPKIVTDGLVFAYDMGNTQKSWKGAPVTNLAVYTDYSNRNYDTLYDIGGFGGDDADVFYYRNGGYNNLPYKKMVKHTGGTGGSYINEHSYFTLVEGTTYIITCYMKSNAVTTVSGHTLALNRDSDNAYRVPADIALTTDWVKQSWTYTCAVGEGGTTYHFRQIVYNDTSLPVEVYWCGLQISVGTVSYPYVNGARSNTQALVDLMGTNTITATSLTYAADNTFSFNGSSNYINLNTNIQSGYTSASYEFWCRPSILPVVGNYYQLYIQESSTWIALYNIGGNIFFGIDLNNGSGWFDNNGGSATGAKTNTTLLSNTSYHVAYSWNGSTVSVYLNGKLESTASTLQLANGRQNVTQLGVGTTSRNIGSRYSGSSNNWIGSIYSIKFYNTALTSVEVQQNFNALRGRYGV